MRDADRTPMSVMDANCAALGGTMLCYNSDRRNVVVPSSVDGRSVTVLGAGALCCPNACSVELQEGYRALSGDALRCLPSKCRELTLPASLERVEKTAWNDLSPLHLIRLKRRLGKKDWAELMDASLDAGGGYRLIRGADENHPVWGVAARIFTGMGKVPRIVDPGEYGLPIFSMDGSAYNKTVFANVSCRSPGATGGFMTEDRGVLEGIAAGRLGRRDPDCEALNDSLLREGGPKAEALRQRTAILGFDARAALFADGARQVVIEIHAAYHYAQLLRRVRMDGHEYYVYSRQSLVNDTVRLQPTATRFIKYLREDVGVYDASGLVTDPVISEKVYEKYRLLSVL